MSERTTHASLTLANPDEELIQDQVDLPTASAASESESRKDRHFEDGSVLVMRSRKGGEMVAQVFDSADEAAAPMDSLPDPS